MTRFNRDLAISNLTAARLLGTNDPTALGFPPMLVSLAAKIELDLLEIAHAARPGAALQRDCFRFLAWVVETTLERHATAEVRKQCGPALDVVQRKARGERVNSNAANAANAAYASSAANAAYASSAANAANAAYASSAAYAAYAASDAARAKAAYAANAAANAAAAYAAARSECYSEMRTKLLEIVATPHFVNEG